MLRVVLIIPMRASALVLLLFAAATAAAQDVLTLGTGSAPSSGTASVPVFILDHTGTSLGTDAGTGNRIQGIAFKVLFAPELVSSVTFSRGGVAAGLTPLYETTLTGSGWMSYVGSFAESSNAIPFNPNPPAPGDQIGTLSVTLQPAATNGMTVPLTLDPGSAMLSNQTGSTRENVIAGNLTLVNGLVNVTSSLAAPASLVATALGTVQVNLTWVAVTGANHYEIWRFSGGAFIQVGTPSGPSFSDTSVAASTTYVYHVRAVATGGGLSDFSNLDAATTIVFTDDPLVAQTTLIRNVHIAQLRTAVNAFRATAGLPPLASDPTLGAGQLVRAQHITALRTGLDQARSALVLPALTYTDPTLTAGLVVRALHVQELRNGVK